MLPTWQGLWLIADIAGLALGVIVIGWEWNHRTATKPILGAIDTTQV
jgi:hypothetical protein